MIADNLYGLKVLVVEDEFLVAMGIEQILRDFGCEIVGPVPELDTAVDLARSQDVDGAVLDVNLSGTPVYPAARVLAARQIPFILTTGYEASALPEEFRAYPRLRKPFSAGELKREIARTFVDASSRAIGEGACR